MANSHRRFTSLAVPKKMTMDCVSVLAQIEDALFTRLDLGVRERAVYYHSMQLMALCAATDTERSAYKD